MGKKVRKMDEKSCSKAQKFNNVVTIDSLNDDCLQSIFEFLPVVDRLTVERVCKRWKLIITPLWQKHRIFDLNDEYLYEDLTRKFINLNIFMQVLKRCASHIVKLNLSLFPRKLQKVTLGLPSTLYPQNYGSICFGHVSQDVQTILMQCTNLEELILDWNIIHMTEAPLSRLLSKNKKIRSLFLRAFDFWHETKISKFYKNLESLTILRCYSPIEFLKLHLLREAPKLKSLCLEISSESTLGFPCYFLSDNLTQLNLQIVDDVFFDMSLDIGLSEILNLQYLKVLSADLCLDDNEAHELTRHCKNLEALEVGTWSDTVTDIGLRKINTLLPKLVCFKYDSRDHFTDGGFCCLNENLKTLDIRGDHLKSEKLIDFVMRARSLEILRLDLCGDPCCCSGADEIIEFVTDLVSSISGHGYRTPLSVDISYFKFNDTLRSEVKKVVEPCALLELYTDKKLPIDFGNYIDL